MIEVAAMFNAGVGVLDDDEEAFLCIDAGRSPPRPRVGEARPLASAGQYYRNANLSRLRNPYCPGFPSSNARPGQKGYFCLGSGNRDKKLLSRLVTLTGTTNRDKRSLFFYLFSFSQFFFYFNYTFAFQLNLCIGI